MLKQLLITCSLALFACCAASTQSKAADDTDVPWTDDEFAGDCELAGGEPDVNDGYAICVFPDGEDLYCEAGDGEIGECVLSDGFRRIKRAENRAPAGGVVAQSPKRRDHRTAPEAGVVKQLRKPARR